MLTRALVSLEIEDMVTTHRLQVDEGLVRMDQDVLDAHVVNQNLIALNFGKQQVDGSDLEVIVETVENDTLRLV